MSPTAFWDFWPNVQVGFQGEARNPIFEDFFINYPTKQMIQKKC